MGNGTLKGSAITRWRDRNKLKLAIVEQNEQLLESLLRVHGAGCQSVRLNKEGDTPFILAVRTEFSVGIELLLLYNAANPNLPNHIGSTALHLALRASTLPWNTMEEYLILLLRITRGVSEHVLTSVLDPETSDLQRVLTTASLVARHSVQYQVRATLMFTLLTYHPALIPPMLTNHGADPTGVTDPRIDTSRLWQEFVDIHYFKQPVLERIPKDLLLLLVQGANGDEAVDVLVSLLLDSLQVAGCKQTPVETEFHYEALTTLALGGCTFSVAELVSFKTYIPEVFKWYMGNLCKPSSLMFLTRKVIRSSMRCNVIYGSKHLPLPSKLQQYLRFE